MELLVSLAMKFWQWSLLILFVIIGFGLNLLDKKIDCLEAMISKQVEELKKIKEKNKSAKGK